MGRSPIRGKRANSRLEFALFPLMGLLLTFLDSQV